MSTTDRIAQAAQHFFDEHQAKKRHSGCPDDCHPRDLAEAYAIQDKLQELNIAHGVGALAGWKVALTTPVMQQMVGVDHPCEGGIHASRVHASPATLPAADYVNIGIEPEIAVRLGADLTGGGHTRASVASAVGALMPAMEIVDDRGLDYDLLDAPLLVADNSFNFGIILGPELTDWRGLDLTATTARLSINGEAAGDGVSSAVMGHPFEALAWLANNLAERGRQLHAGEIVMTGSIVATKWPSAGDVIVNQIDGLGEARLTLT